MFSKKSIAVALGCALALGVTGIASADIVNVGGVQWDTSSPFDLTIQTLNLRETQVATVGDVLTGYGQVGSINGNNNFCVGSGGAGCVLTFTFSYTLSSIPNGHAIFNNGSFQAYVGAPGSFNMADPTSASTGTPWVTLTGHTGTNVFGTGELVSNFNGTITNPTSGSAGFAWLDATGGPAAYLLHSMSQSDGMGGFSDFSLNSSFLFSPANSCGSVTSDPSNLCTYPIEGNGSLIGRTVAVPEPSALGMLGLGMGVLGFFFWRRRREAPDRA